MFNSENIFAGRIKKKMDFVGKEKEVSTPLSFSGGVGSGYLPVSNAGVYKSAKIYARKVYATCQIEREAMKASSNNTGAFVQATAETVKKTVESYMRNDSRIKFGDGSGILGRGDAATDVLGAGTSGDPYLVVIDQTVGSVGTFIEANFEEKDFVQVVSGMNAGNNAGGSAEGGVTVTNLLEIVSVDPATGTIGLVGTSPVLAALVAGPSPLPATSGLAMQRSYLKEPIGIGGVVRDQYDPRSASADLYEIPAQRRWQSFLEDAAGAGITVDKMNKVMLQVEKKIGKVPNLIMTGYEQFQNILALLEDQKVYNLPNKNLKGHLGFNGVEFMSTRGPIGIFTDRFCPKDQIFFLNDNFIESHHRPGFGWFDDDGTVFLRDNDEDQYSARYGGYHENFITPTAHGMLKGLAV